MANSFTIQKRQVYYPVSAFFDKAIGAGPINWSALALARFLLSFVVVSAHASYFTDDLGPLKWISYFNAFNAIFGFLLISGLSIGKSILKDREGYILRRVQRIYPVYLASVVLSYLVNPRHFDIEFILILIVNIFFLNQVIMPASYVGPAWTLSLEVWLYCLAPLFLKFSYKTLLTIICISFFSFCVYTCGQSLFNWNYYSGVNYGLNLLFLSFIWIAGFMLAIFPKNIKNISLIISLIFIIQFGLSSSIQIIHRIKHQQVNLIFTEDTIGFIFEIICLAFIWYIVISNRNLSRVFLSNKKLFDFLGNISYSLYLTHVAVLTLCKKNHINNWAAMTFCCLFIASIIYLLFDFYSKKRVVQAPA